MVNQWYWKATSHYSAISIVWLKYIHYREMNTPIDICWNPATSELFDITLYSMQWVYWNIQYQWRRKHGHAGRHMGSHGMGLNTSSVASGLMANRLNGHPKCAAPFSLQWRPCAVPSCYCPLQWCWLRLWPECRQKLINLSMTSLWRSQWRMLMLCQRLCWNHKWPQSHPMQGKNSEKWLAKKPSSGKPAASANDSSNGHQLASLSMTIKFSVWKPLWISRNRNDWWSWISS